MAVKLENIDELRRRTNVSYEVAKDALEKYNDDLLEALVYLEKQNMIRQNAANENKNSFWTKVKNLIKKGNNTKLVIHKKETVLLSLPVTMAVIIAIIAPHVTLIAFIIALLTGYRVRFESKDVNCNKVNNALNKVSDTVDSTKKKLTEDNNTASAN